MGRAKLSRWWSLAAVAALAVVVAWLLYLGWRSRDKDSLATYGAFVLPVAVLVGGWATWAWRKAKTDPAELGIDSEWLDRASDRLAIATRSQWEKAAGERELIGADPIQVTWGRSAVPLAGPMEAALESDRFDPLPGLKPVRPARLKAGQISDLHALYGGLGSGRLILAGPPGAGKSGAAVLLVLAALRHRDRVPAEDKPKVPVPVLVTAHGWDLDRQSVTDWLTRALQETFPMFAGPTGAATATALIEAGRIALIIDGLDEIAADQRPVALQVLSQQASFRIVVLSRTAELAAAASQSGVLRGAAAIELRAVSPSDAASYLERIEIDPPPAGWENLIKKVRGDPAGPLSQALSNPLNLTLVRDTCKSADDVRELLDTATLAAREKSGTEAVEAITDFLLDRVLPAAYSRTPGQPPPPFDLATAQNALTRIATQMNKEGSRDLQWWRLPAWTRSLPRFVASGFAFWVVSAPVLAVVVGLTNLTGGILYATVTGILTGVFGGFPFGVAAGFAELIVSGPPAGSGKIRRPRLRQIFTPESAGLGIVISLAVGLMSALASLGLLAIAGGVHPSWLTLLKGSIAVGVGLGFLAGAVALLAAGLAIAVEDASNTSALSPAVSWRNDRRRATAIGLIAWTVTFAVLGLAGTVLSGPIAGIRIGPVIGLEAGLMAGLATSHTWPARLAAAQLALRWRSPMRLMKFLDDAHQRNVLRTVGPVYQFRHARLQDRLAEPTPRAGHSIVKSP